MSLGWALRKIFRNTFPPYLFGIHSYAHTHTHARAHAHTHPPLKPYEMSAWHSSSRSVDGLHFITAWTYQSLGQNNFMYILFTDLEKQQVVKPCFQEPSYSLLSAHSSLRQGRYSATSHSSFSYTLATNCDIYLFGQTAYSLPVYMNSL